MILGLYSSVMTALIGKAIEVTIGLRQPGGIVEKEQAYADVLSGNLEQLSADDSRAKGTGEEPESASALVARLREVLLTGAPSGGDRKGGDDRG